MPEIDCEALISFDAAQAILAAEAQPLGIEAVPLARAGRRILATPLHARIDSPRNDAAAMDGFAVCDADLADGQRRLPVAGIAYAGGSAPDPLAPRTALRIMTGATLPQGANRVVMLEQARAEGGFVDLPAQLSEKRHVRPRASDFAAGELLLAPGREIDPRAMVVAAAADAEMLTVYRRPRVALIASGDELAAPGAAAGNSTAIPDCLSEAVLLLCRQWRAKPGRSRRVPDDAAALHGAAEDLLGESDVLVVIGGASRGDRDLARAGLAPLGLEIAFADVAIKPGKPVWYGRIGGRHVLGLPGNPTAAMTVARLFLAPLLAGLAGRGAGAAMRPTMLPLAGQAPLAEREQFLCGEMEREAVRIIERQAASSQAMLRSAELLVRVPAGVALGAGAPVATFRF
jgi:molybdopterin molybdotransferase